MAIDWNVVSSVATAFASIATAVGVGFVGIQLKLTKKQGQAEFEDRLDQQYREISMALPVDVLIGKEDAQYNYLDLSNEQVYYRAKGRISNHTWVSWSIGIKAHIEKKAFKSIFDEVKENAGFSYIERLIEDDFVSDPFDWFK